ncbi:MAG TPA: hypothetical protein VIS56_00380 [Candidatus Saccharimonadales bacterium]
MERSPDTAPHSSRRNNLLLAVAAGGLLVGTLAACTTDPRNTTPGEHGYPIHHSITTTVFWVGEEGSPDNRGIHNRSSTWIEDWQGAYGGVDDPKSRCGFLPCGFKPKENPFYFALPYNDLNEDCTPKPSRKHVSWYTAPPPTGNSVVKNQWIKITFGDKTAYAQWEDAGPFGEDDANYVFGSVEPQADAGLDISPATATYLGLDGKEKTSWQFIPEKAVPEGPWRETITKSPAGCAE